MKATALLSASLILIAAGGIIGSQKARNRAHRSEQRIATLEREVAELRAQSRANVLNALPSPPESKVTLTIP